MSTAAGTATCTDLATGGQPTERPSVRITRSFSSVTLFELDPGVFNVPFVVCRNAQRLLLYLISFIFASYRAPASRTQQQQHKFDPGQFTGLTRAYFRHKLAPS